VKANSIEVSVGKSTGQGAEQKASVEKEQHLASIHPINKDRSVVGENDPAELARGDW